MPDAHLRRHPRLRQRTYRLAAVLPFFMVAAVAAGDAERFDELESKLESAQSALLAARLRDDGQSASDGNQPDKERQAHTQELLAVLAEMDALATAAAGTPRGPGIAIRTLGWSWMLDLDLDHLVQRFRRIVDNHPDAWEVLDALDMVQFAGAATGTPAEWSRQLEKLARVTTRAEIRLMTLHVLGRLQLNWRQVAEAKATYERIIQLDPKSDLADLARGSIYDIEHLQVGMTAPDFSSRTLDDQEFSLKSLRGRVVLLNFWATWCPRCVSEIPLLRTTAKRFADRPFDIVNVSLDDGPSIARPLIEQQKMPGIQTWSAAGENAAKLYNAMELPAWFLIDARGVIRARDTFDDDLAPAIQAALRAEPRRSGSRP